MTTVDLPLLPLGRGTDLGSERGVECPGDLPAASDPDLVARAPRRQGARSATGCSCSGTTTSATRSSSSPTSPATRSSSPATRPPGRRRSTSSSAACTSWPSRPTSSPRPEQKVILPDLAAGCSMADMARIAPGRGRLGRAHGGRRRRRRRAGDLHELLRRHQGVLRPPRRRGLHLLQRAGRARVGLRAEGRRTPRCCSCPTSTSAATPRCWRWASPSTTAWSGTRTSRDGGLTAEQLRDARMILWKGHCSVHGRFSADVRRRRARARSPASRSWCTPSARTRSCSRPTWSARPSSSSRPSRPRRPARPGRSAPSSTW